MSRYDLNWMIEEYTDDFGVKYPNLPVKIQGNAPQLSTFYVPKTNVACAGGVLFKKRHLSVTFADGRKLDYPVDDYASAVAFAIVLKGLSGNDKALCIDLIGERWIVVPGPVLSGSLTFRTTPYTGLAKRKVYKSYTFDYTSSVTSIGEIRLPVRIPTDNTELENCAKSNLAGETEGAGICAAAGLVEARHWIIQALADDSNPKLGKVTRKAYISAGTPAEIKSSAIGVAGCAYCLGYQGESIPNFHLLVIDDDD